MLYTNLMSSLISSCSLLAILLLIFVMMWGHKIEIDSNAIPSSMGSRFEIGNVVTRRVQQNWFLRIT
jgi:hypothetical protein